MVANITFLSFLLFSMGTSIRVAVNTWLNCSFNVCNVTLSYRDQRGLNSAKIISQLISLIISLSAGNPQHDGSTPKGTPPNFRVNRSAVGKIVDFRQSRRISETVHDRVQVAVHH